jgi:hypothetical protein
LLSCEENVKEKPSSPQTGACGVVYVLDRRFQVGVEGEEKEKKALAGLFFIGLQFGRGQAGLSRANRSWSA